MKDKTFKDSMMARIFDIPIEAGARMDLYHFILALPAIFFVVVFGVVFALVFDLFIATMSIGEQ